MKKNYLFFLLLIFPVCFSNGQNRLKQDEKQLMQQIEKEEEEKALKAQSEADEKQKRRSQGVQFTEERKPEQGHRPVVIDIIGNRQKPHEKLKLSQLFNRIEYLRIEMDPDSLIAGSARFLIGKNHIYAFMWGSGILQYDRRGRFEQYICKNEAYFTNMDGGGVMISSEQAGRFVGARDAYLAGGKLYYIYEDAPAGKKYLIAYEAAGAGQNIPVEMPSMEGERPIRGKGEIVADLGPETFGNFRGKTPFVAGSDMLALPQRSKPVYGKNDFISVVSFSGDTICRFKDFDPIENYSASVARGVDDGESYYRNGALNIRQPFNDTIYQLEPPNRLIPRFVLNFGDQGIKRAYDGANPGYNLKDKLIPNSWLETDKHVFVTYTKDYSCPNTAQSGSLKFSRIVYDKSTKRTIVVYIDEKPYMSEGGMAWPSPANLNVENDIDGVKFTWPVMATDDGKPYIVLSGKDLQEKPPANIPAGNLSEKDKVIAVYY